MRRFIGCCPLVRTASCKFARVGAVRSLVVIGRILEAILDHLVAHGTGDVDMQFVGDGHGVAKHVGQFLRDLAQLVVVPADLARSVRCDPLEMFHQFRGFNGQGHAQILRRMELLPVPFVHELTHHLAQFTNSGLLVGGHVHSVTARFA